MVPNSDFNGVFFQIYSFEFCLWNNSLFGVQKLFLYRDTVTLYFPSYIFPYLIKICQKTNITKTFRIQLAEQNQIVQAVNHVTGVFEEPPQDK